jgi:hypothetical protein
MVPMLRDGNCAAISPLLNSGFAVTGDVSGTDAGARTKR